MKARVISYSLSGNNEALAKNIASELGVEQVRIKESKPRNMGTIMLDVIFNRTPKTEPKEIKTLKDEFLIFVGPVWMGMAATPFRKYFKNLKGELKKYAYVSISGGALGPNNKLGEDLEKRLGRKPEALINLYIADLMPSEPKPQMKDTMAYRLSDKDIKELTSTAVKELKKNKLSWKLV